MGVAVSMEVVSLLICFLLNHEITTASSADDGGPCGVELKDISVFPGDEDYSAAIQLYNQAYAHYKPAFVAFPLTEEHVMKCLKCSALHSIPCSVKSGGHDNSGYSTINGNGFLINLQKMQAISVSPDKIEAQAGVRWGDVYELLDRLNSQQLVTGGLCPAVGMAGYTLGGGYSALSRMYGLAIDNLISMRMVTANGSEVLFINETVNSDLFWALRGGGGGNFGIVTEFTFRTHTVNVNKYTLIELNFEAGTESLQALIIIGQLNIHLPREMYLDMVITSNKILSVFCIFLGEYKIAVQHLEPLIDLASQINYSDFISYYAVVNTVASKRGMTVPIIQTPFLLRGCILKELDSITAGVLFSVDIPDQCHIAFMHLGGAIADIPATDTAYFNRHGHLEYYSPCLYQNREEEIKVFDFEDKLYTKLNNGGHCAGCYVNDMDRFLPNWQEKYYGENYQKLVEIQEKWNPAGVGHFHFLQEIGSSYSVNDQSK